LDVSLAIGVGALREEVGFVELFGGEELHVGEEEFGAGFGPGDAIGGEIVFGLELLDGFLGGGVE